MTVCQILVEGDSDRQSGRTDSDGTPDYQDTDSDNDGITRLSRRQIQKADQTVDSDGTPDYQETDSDNDGIPDSSRREIRTGGPDT